jgi:hypothetical protein
MRAAERYNQHVGALLDSSDSDGGSDIEGLHTQIPARRLKPARRLLGWPATDGFLGWPATDMGVLDRLRNALATNRQSFIETNRNDCLQSCIKLENCWGRRVSINRRPLGGIRGCHGWQTHFCSEGTRPDVGSNPPPEHLDTRVKIASSCQERAK